VTERTLADSLAEMTSLAERVRAEAMVMRARTRRQGRVYIVAGICVAGYLSWSFDRVARFLETERLAAISGDIAIGRGVDLVDDASGEARASAPQIVRAAEATLLAAIPDLGRQLDDSLRVKVRAAVSSTVAPYDHAFIEELSKLPDGRKRIAAAAADPGEAQKLFAEIHARVREHSEVRAAAETTAPELVALRDHFRHLQADSGLSPSDRAERRFLQVALTRVPSPAPKTQENPAPEKP